VSESGVETVSKSSKLFSAGILLASNGLKSVYESLLNVQSVDQIADPPLRSARASTKGSIESTSKAKQC
jgi:hypothetical protein